jgi:hypothetical protein
VGLNIDGTKSLMYAKTQGVCFSRTAMIGRHELHLSADALRTNLLDFGYFAAASEHNDLMAGGFAEPLLTALGAIEICSFDASDYEGASNVHDFNFPIDERFKNRFTAVIDGGTLEHIFNFPVAIKNCMELVAVGGHFIAITPTNNWLGHGFYQFSPELFFRIFSEPNGFRIVRMIIFENQPEAEWFEVADPEAIRERVSLVNAQPTSLLVLAEKVESVQIFAAPPQQSDYVALWKSSDTKTQAVTNPARALINCRPTGRRLFSRVAHKLYAFVPDSVKSFYRRVHNQPFSNPRFFRRMQISGHPLQKDQSSQPRNDK